MLYQPPSRITKRRIAAPVLVAIVISNLIPKLVSTVVHLQFYPLIASLAFCFSDFTSLLWRSRLRREEAPELLQYLRRQAAGKWIAARIIWGTRNPPALNSI